MKWSYMETVFEDLKVNQDHLFSTLPYHDNKMLHKICINIIYQTINNSSSPHPEWARWPRGESTMMQRAKIWY